MQRSSFADESNTNMMLDLFCYRSAMAFWHSFLEDCATHARAGMAKKMELLIKRFCSDSSYLMNDKLNNQYECCHEMRKINRTISDPGFFRQELSELDFSNLILKASRPISILKLCTPSWTSSGASVQDKVPRVDVPAPSEPEAFCRWCHFRPIDC